MVPALQFETSAFYSGVPTSSQLLSCGICNILVVDIGTFTALTYVTVANAFDGSLFFDSQICILPTHSAPSCCDHHFFLISFSLVLRVLDGYIVFQCSRVETVS